MPGIVTVPDDVAVLVGLLDEQRRSIDANKLDASVAHLLLTPAGRLIFHPVRAKSAEGLFQENEKQFPRNVAEELLWEADAPSLLFTLTKPKVFRLRDWGKQLGLVGNGNQITERGLLLQSLMGQDQVSAIRTGRLESCNPFRLSFQETLFFLFILLERDGSWPFLMRSIASLGEGYEIGGVKADDLTCRALIELLAEPRRGLPASEILCRRDLHRLVAIMAQALRIPIDSRFSTQRIPRPARIRKSEQRSRTRTNTADDQAIPRFENLVDLGFLAKPAEHVLADGIRPSRLEWRYVVAHPLLSWIYAASGTRAYDDTFLWNRFAHCAAAAFADKGMTYSAAKEPLKQLELLLQAYKPIHRQFGHTPFESMALLAMIQGLAEGVICEMGTMHSLFLQFKREDLFSACVKFKSGNELDKMFVHIEPTLLDSARAFYASKL